MAQRVMFFSFDKCFLIAEKVVHPQHAVLHCFLAGGELQSILDKKHEIMEIGRHLGCKYMSISGRRGWERVLESEGWSHLYSIMHLPIQEYVNGTERNQIRGQTTARN
jgi:hypothetical protein